MRALPVINWEPLFVDNLPDVSHWERTHPACPLRPTYNQQSRSLITGSAVVNEREMCLSTARSGTQDACTPSYQPGACFR